jgi:hypothetical protein
MIHFGFTKLVVGDLDLCAAFYSEVFELREQESVHDEIAGRAIDEMRFEATAPAGPLLRLTGPTGSRRATRPTLPSLRP